MSESLNQNFNHLKVHTQYSICEGAAKIDDLQEYCKSNKIKSLQPGLNVFLLHLGYDNEELRAVTIEHPEYGSLWRQLDYDVFNSKEIKQLLKDEGIKLVNWGEIQDVIYPN